MSNQQTVNPPKAAVPPATSTPSPTTQDSPADFALDLILLARRSPTLRQSLGTLLNRLQRLHPHIQLYLRTDPVDV